jgi:hypothetical protein
MTQIGESVAVSLPEKDEPIKAFKAELEEVEFDSTIKVSLNDVTVPTPHWKNGVDVEGESGESKRPAVIVFEKNGGKKKVKITVNILVCENISGKAKLKGRVGDLEIEGEIDALSAGNKIVNAEIKAIPNEIKWYKGDFGFGLEIEDLGGSRAIGSARLEVFLVVKTPAAYFQNKKGVWAEVLRFLCRGAGPRLIGKKDDVEIAESIVRYCHGPHNLKYDSAGGGASHYGLGRLGGAFKLKLYLKRFYPFANCYDQAGAIQSLCGAVGVSVTWIFLEPFGFIKTANLLGYGACNNPFFAMAGKPQIVGTNDPDRTPFGNHAFGSQGGIPGKMLDACAGPHCRNETASEYISASVDSATTLYTLYTGFRAGKKSDMIESAGVTSIL